MTLLGWHSSIMDIIILCERIFLFLCFQCSCQRCNFILFSLSYGPFGLRERERGSRGKWVELAYFQPTLLYSIVPFSLSLTQTGNYSLVPFFLGTWIQMSLKPVVNRLIAVPLTLWTSPIFVVCTCGSLCL